MHSANRYVSFRDPGLEHGSVRRYNVDFCQVYRPPEALLQDGSGNLKLYVVARRNSVSNLQSYMPYDMFSHGNDWDNVQDACSVAEDDIFDRGVSSSEDEGAMYIGEATPPLIASRERSAIRSAIRSAANSATRSAVRSGLHSATRSIPPRYSPAGSAVRRSASLAEIQAYSPPVVPEDVMVDAEPLDEGPAYEEPPMYEMAEYHAISPEPVLSRSPESRNVSFAKAAAASSPKPRGKRTLSSRRDIAQLTPTGYSPFASFGAVYSSGLDNQTTRDMSAATANTLAAIERMKKRRERNAPKPSGSHSDSSAGVEPPPRRGRGRPRGRKAAATEAPLPPPTGAAAISDNRFDGVSDEGAGLHMRIGDVAEMATSGTDKRRLGAMALSELSQGGTLKPGRRGTKRAAITPKPSKRDIPRPGRPFGTIGAKVPKAQRLSATRLIDSGSDHSDYGVQTLPAEPDRASLGVGSDDFDMDELGTLADRVREGRLGLDGRRRAAARTAQAREAVNSAMLLNSWYISYGDERKRGRKGYNHVEPYVGRNMRYPSRSRLPPIQHWNSNVASDGSSVLFLIGVTSDDKKLGVRAQHASGDVVILNEDVNALDSSTTSVKLRTETMPESSLVLTESEGVMEMQVIEPAADQPLAIANRAHSSPGPRAGALALAAPPRATTTKRGAGRRPVRPPASEGGAAAPRGKSTSARKGRKGVGKKSHEMTVREALEILKSDSVDSLAIEPPPVEEAPADGSPRSRRHADFYQELVYHPAKEANLPALVPDSVTMHNGKQVSYRSFFRMDEMETQLYNGCLFQPMIMNSRCRSSNVIIPIGRQVTMGNVKANFICGYVYSGEDLFVRGVGMSWPIKVRNTFFLPMFEEWSIHNDSPSMDANIAVTFVSI